MLLRTTASSTGFAMFLSNRWFFSDCLKGAHCPGPHLIEVSAQPRNTFRIQLVQPPRSGLAVGYKPCILEHTQMLRDGGTTHRHGASKLIYGNGPFGELLKDRHARCVAEGVEPGL